MAVVPTFLPSSTVVLFSRICQQGCHRLDKRTEDVPDKLGSGWGRKLGRVLVNWGDDDD